MLCGDCHLDLDGECECPADPPFDQATLDAYYSRSTPCPGCGEQWKYIFGNVLEVTHTASCPLA